jgi:acid phosphatase
LLRTRLAASLIAGLGAAAMISPSIPVQAATAVPPLDHVFVIAMENHSYNQIIGSSATPYINSLLTSGGLATSYYAVAHPSLPNYLSLTGGGTFGITSDCTSCWVSATNIGDTVERAKKTWKAYMESMPSPCFVGDSYPYAQKHDPFIYFNDIRTNSTRCQAHVLPYLQMATDLKSAATTPNYAFITPNMCNDMHDCTAGTGDSWLKQQVPTILASPAFTLQHSLLALTWDEDDSSGSNQVPMILVGTGITPAFKSSLVYNHYSTLRTVEAALGLSTLTSNDANATAMSVFFGAPPANQCTSASLSASVTSPQSAGVSVSFTASSAGCTSPVYEFWLQPASGSWAMMQSFSSSAIWKWDTSGQPAGAYVVHVWANQSGDSTATWEAYGSDTVSLTLSGLCASASLNPANPIAPADSIVALSASSTGCSNPKYEFWVEHPDGGWHLVQGWGGGAFNWSTGGLSPGSYTVHVWANQEGDATATWEAYGADTVALTASACTSAALSPIGASVAAGSTAVLTASSTGCPNPRYELWVQYPGGSWKLVQGWGGRALNWSTAGLGPGTYTLHAWADEQGADGSTWQAYASDTVTLNGCTSAAVNPVSTSVSVGTTIYFSGSSTGCPNPVYELWFHYPDGTWHDVLPFGAANSWHWDTTGWAPGSYAVHVWANNQGADTSSWEAYGSATYTLT